MIAMHGARVAKNRPSRHRKSRIMAAIWILLLFFGAIALQFLFEHAEEVQDHVPMPQWLRLPVERVGSWFNSPFSFIPRPTEARYTALVSISDQVEGSLPGPCPLRALVSRLLPAINNARPMMIVVDLAFPAEDSSDSCPMNAPETKTLLSSIDQVAKTTPIVLGQASTKLDEMPDALAAQLRSQGFEENELLLRKPFLQIGSAGNVSFGLIRLNVDLNKVPIVWFGHEQEQSSPKPYPTLGLVSAEVYRASFPHGIERLQNFANAGYHPVTSLLPKSDFAVVNAIDIICAHRPQNHDWAGCKGPEAGGSSEYPKLHGRIVVVGVDDRPQDMWNTSSGRLPGYTVQANYVEALLDARTYRPLGFWATLALSFAWLILVELPFWLMQEKLMKGLIFSVAVSIIILFLAKYVALVNFGIFINLFAPSALLLGTSLIHVLAHRSEQMKG